MKLKLYAHSRQMLADTFSPVGLYLKLRDKFINSLLLESSDYHGNENSLSFICFSPFAQFKVHQRRVWWEIPGTETQKFDLKESEQTNTMDYLQAFLDHFEAPSSEHPFDLCGIFGYTAYDAVRYFEDIQIPSSFHPAYEIPEMQYHFYRYVIAINHFKDELFLFEYNFSESENTLDEVIALINTKNIPSYRFSVSGAEHSNLKDADFIDKVEKARSHCKRGDVFQMVLSRQFSQAFRGDEFNVYRALRSINPSPYLFYFDYGNFKIFGSSPEAQLVINQQKAEIHPIAGTFKRTGDDKADAEIAKKLFDDEKESAEHVMLVDLARNDLSRNGSNVKVEIFKEIQYYSHLIHLVSKVTAEIENKASFLKLFADTFPAGTLSGAPKYKAMELINRYENQNRGFYGGAIGFFGLDGSCNHAIMIRSFLSKNYRLFYQAGAGIVYKSDPQKELEEVNNKLRALRSALEMAEKM